MNHTQKSYARNFLGNISVFPSSFQTNNRQVVSGAANGGVRVWDVISGECLQHLRGHVKSVTAVACTAEHLLSVSLESVLCIWDRSRGECLHRLKQVSLFNLHYFFLAANARNSMQCAYDYSNWEKWKLSTLQSHVLWLAVKSRATSSANQEQKRNQFSLLCIFPRLTPCVCFVAWQAYVSNDGPISCYFCFGVTKVNWKPQHQNFWF